VTDAVLTDPSTAMPPVPASLAVPLAAVMGNYLQTK
jgi:hypothetical protein